MTDTAQSAQTGEPTTSAAAAAASKGLARYRKATLASAILLVFIIWTGAAVRLSGSGLGCPNWPTCNSGEVIPARGSHARIEFGNRVVTGLCLLAAAVDPSSAL